jgi:hypothetical protein
MIIIPYTHYEFQPPPRINQAEFESLKNINEVELKQLLTATEERERCAFIHARPVQHVLTKFTFLTLVASLVCGLLLLGLYASGLGDPIVSATWGAVLFAFCGSFFVAAVVFRSYAETYSSFRKFLAARQSFYLRLKRQIDSTLAFDVFIYNPRINVPLVRLLSWLRSNP